MAKVGPDDIPGFVRVFSEGTEHLISMAKKLEFAWDGSIEDPFRGHNMFARNLITAYVSKFSDLSTGILDSIEKDNFLVYALCGRSLIETTATLRHYLRKEYKPLLDKGSLEAADMQELIKIDDRHLRGTRFDWESFLMKNYSQMKEDVVEYLKSKKKKGKKTNVAEEAIIQPQINVLTCIEGWARQTPEVMIAYNLFCDLVHPNIGSSFLVASTSPDGLYFSRFKGEPVGRAIFEQSFPILVSLVYREFGQGVTLLAATIWDEDELP